MEVEQLIQRIREQLLGRYFSNKSELRHIAEGAGFDFVPVEFVSSDEKEVLVTLRPKGVGEIRVQGVRTVPWQPYHIVEVQAA